MKKKIVIMMLISLVSVSNLVLKTEAYDNDKGNNRGPEVTDHFSVIDENGNSEIVHIDEIENDQSKVDELTKEYNIVATIGDKKDIVETVETKAEADAIVKAKKRARTAATYSVEEKSRSITYGVVYLKGSKESGKAYLTYDNISNPGYDGYTTGDYAKDAAYIGTVNGKVRAMQAGVIMDFNPSDVNIVDYSVANISHYYVSEGYLYHRYFYGTSSSSSQRVGYALKYMSEGKKYYSYDGHYFYDTYVKMISDYKNGIRRNSINASNAYYNYYQFLSHRSKSLYTDANYNTIVESKVGSASSKMRNLGSYYNKYQGDYGVNSLLMFGVSGNESAWGTSAIARDKNNLFGHGAVDSNPYYGANGYAKASDSIKFHAEKFISTGYLDNEDWRYQGAHLGDKLSGINVRYASDPYWGEKAASVHYYFGLTQDYDRYQIGVINKVLKGYNLYKNPSYSSTITHVVGSGKSPRVSSLPVIILDKVSDSSGNIWYKIQSDTTLTENRNDTDWDGVYSLSRDYLYVPSKDVSLISNDKYIIGDVNTDGKITSLDYIQIKNHIMGTKKLTGDYLMRADVNKDGKVSSLDYMRVKNHIMGVSSLF